MTTPDNTPPVGKEFNLADEPATITFTDGDRVRPEDIADPSRNFAPNGDPLEGDDRHIPDPQTVSQRASAIAAGIPGATASGAVVTVTGFEAPADSDLAMAIDEAVFGEAPRPLYSAAPGYHLTPDPRQAYLAFLATLDPAAAIADVRAMLASVGGLPGFAIGGPARALASAGFHMDAVLEQERDRPVPLVAFGVRAVQTADDRPLAAVFEAKDPSRVLTVESVEGPPFDVRDRVEVLSQVRLYETLDAEGEHAFGRIAAVVYTLNRAIAAGEHTVFIAETDMQDAAMAIVKTFCPDVITVSREP